MTSDLDGVRHITEGGGFKTVVVDFKSLVDVTVWVQANLPSDNPKIEHFINLDLLLSRMRQKGVIRKDVRSK